jgi:hypothetical protein
MVKLDKLVKLVKMGNFARLKENECNCFNRSRMKNPGIVPVYFMGFLTVLMMTIIVRISPN